MKKHFFFAIILLSNMSITLFSQTTSDLTDTELLFSEQNPFGPMARYSLNQIAMSNGDWMTCTPYRLSFYNDTVESGTFDLTGTSIKNYNGESDLKANFLSFNFGYATTGFWETRLHRGEGPKLGMGGTLDLNTTGTAFEGTGTMLESGYDAYDNTESSGYYADGDINILWSPANAINGASVGKILSLWEEDAALERWYVDENGNASSSSDLRWKEQIKSIDQPLEKISQINGVSYQWKQHEIEKEKGTQPYRSLGVIAQELEKVLPEAVQTNGQGHKFVSYDQIIPVLVEAVKELNLKQEENGLLKQKVERLENGNELLEKRLLRIEKKLGL